MPLISTGKVDRVMLKKLAETRQSNTTIAPSTKR
jgi:hypothetical protein